LQVRLSEHREAAIADLQAAIADPNTDNVIAHRALGWVEMQKKDWDGAKQEFAKAIAIDRDDPWSRFYSSQVRYRTATFNGQYFQGLANMLQEMRAVLDWNSEFAEAYNMLAMARVEGGGANSAMEAMRAALVLAPRNDAYRLNMARIYMAAKQWDAATSLLQQLQGNEDPQIANTAKQTLEELPTLRKYGIVAQAAAPLAPPTTEHSKSTTSTTSENSDSDETETTAPPPPQPDHRKVTFLKGRIVNVDCSHAPTALLKVAAGKRTLQLRTDDYKNLLLIGADSFSCDWKNVPVAANYKAGGKADGDLVSLEVQ
jgi:tetratricopeptide (TPR) repeat protein